MPVLMMLLRILGGLGGGALANKLATKGIDALGTKFVSEAGRKGLAYRGARGAGKFSAEAGGFLGGEALVNHLLGEGGDDKGAGNSEMLKAIIAQSIFDRESSGGMKRMADIGDAIQGVSRSSAIAALPTDPQEQISGILSQQNSARLHANAYKPEPSMIEIMSRVRPDLFGGNMNG